jgi:hypothetical protein
MELTRAVRWLALDGRIHRQACCASPDAYADANLTAHLGSIRVELIAGDAPARISQRRQPLRYASSRLSQMHMKSLNMSPQIRHSIVSPPK